VRRGPVTILGADDKTYGHIDLPDLTAQAKRLGGAPIFLAHEPDTIAKLPAGIHLALAGHTHCGQVSPPPIGPIVTSSGLGRRYACGVVIEGGRTSVITAGLGASNLPIRLGASPDLWLITVSGR
jgi:predicted MPP superfamily phosphohydrolase